MHALRPFQIAALKSLQNSGATICVAATGSGKSLIYERFAARFARKTLLVTPLVALAKQQASGLREAGVAVTPGGSKSGAWILSPESLLNEGRLRRLTAWRPDFLVVDECHCLWEWGDRFRPAFLRTPTLISELGIKRSLWLTATLPQTAREDLRARLTGPIHEVGSFSLPPGLHIEVLRVPWISRADALLRWLRTQGGPGIVFVATREATLRVYRLIRAAGRAALFYHAGLSREERSSIEIRIGSGVPDVIVATSAFGMGMNHPHLEWVVLWQVPPTLLALTQAIGRAARGPEGRGRALILWDDEDLRLWEWAAQGSPRLKEELRQAFDYVAATQCRQAGLARYFGVPARLCGCCDVCRQE